MNFLADIRKHLSLFWVAGIFLALCLSLQMLFPGVCHVVDLRIYDLLSGMHREKQEGSPVVIVDVDESSIAEFGQWPWPRYIMASLLASLQRMEPAFVGLDCFFAEQDRTSLNVIRERYHREFNVDLEFVNVPPGLDDNDGYLAMVMGRALTLGAAVFVENGEISKRAFDAPALQLGHAELLDEMPAATDVLANIPELQQALHATGFINTAKDDDGIMRRFPLLQTYRGKIYPHMALAVVMEKLQTKRIDVEPAFWGFDLCLYGSDNACQARIPVNRKGETFLRFDSPPYSHPFVSAADVLQDRIPPGVVKDHILLVGSDATTMYDMHFTPLSRLYNGTELQAIFVDDTLAGKFYRWPEGGKWYAAALSLSAGLGLFFLFLLARPLVAALGSVGIILVLSGINSLFFFLEGVYLPLFPQLATSLVMFLVLALEYYVRARRNFLENMHSLNRARQLTLESMAAIAEMRSPENDGHIRRTQEYVRILARHLQKTGRYPLLTDGYIDLLVHSSPLHDLGKVAIPDNVLFKPGRLTPEEFEVMKQHTLFGVKAIQNAGRELDEDHFLQLAAEVAMSHHEKWDGSGYPYGISGETIPLSGRIMALADVYDALVSRRCYKEGFSHETAREIIVKERGSHFDPEIVDAFLAEEEAFRSFASTWACPAGEAVPASVVPVPPSA